MEKSLRALFSLMFNANKNGPKIDTPTINTRVTKWQIQRNLLNVIAEQYKCEKYHPQIPTEYISKHFIFLNVLKSFYLPAPPDFFGPQLLLSVINIFSCFCILVENKMASSVTCSLSD